jgi:hypothetical protein
MTRVLGLLSMTSAAMLLASPTGTGAADTFGFNAEQIGVPGVDPPWHGKSKYVFVSSNPNPRTSITVDAFDLDGYTTCPPVLLKGETSNTVIGVGTDCDPNPKAWLNEGYGIFLGQPAVSVEITLKDVSASRDVLWEVFGVDAAGKQVFFQGALRGSGVDDSVSQSWTIDQAKLASTQVQPQGGYTGPVGINAVNLKSLGAGATLPAFGTTRLDQSIYLVAVRASGF